MRISSTSLYTYFLNHVVQGFGWELVQLCVLVGELKIFLSITFYVSMSEISL